MKFPFVGQIGGEPVFIDPEVWSFDEFTPMLNATLAVFVSSLLQVPSAAS